MSLCSLTRTGSLSWSYATGYIIYSSPVVSSTGVTYVGDGGGTLWAFSTTGTKVFSYSTGGGVIYSGPTINP